MAEFKSSSVEPSFAFKLGDRSHSAKICRILVPVGSESEFYLKRRYTTGECGNRDMCQVQGQLAPLISKYDW